MGHDLNFRNFSPLPRLGVTNKAAWDSQEYLQYACFVGKDQGLLMVKDKDIYYKPLLGAKRVERLTHDGESGGIYNGVTDWIYRGSNSCTCSIS